MHRYALTCIRYTHMKFIDIDKPTSREGKHLPHKARLGVCPAPQPKPPILNWYFQPPVWWELIVLAKSCSWLEEMYCHVNRALQRRSAPFPQGETTHGVIHAPEIRIGSDWVWASAKATFCPASVSLRHSYFLAAFPWARCLHESVAWESLSQDLSI